MIGNVTVMQIVSNYKRITVTNNLT
jgi:hypothetical protein